MKFKATGLIILTLLMLVALSTLAAEEPQVGVWQHKANLSVNLLQSSYSQNWNGGDKGSIVWSGVVDASLEKQFSESMNWRNALKLAYGQTHSQERDGSGSLYWKRPDKTTDNIEFESLLRWTTSGGWDPFVAFNFNSLFEDLTDDPARPLSFNPLKFKESAGMSRQLIAKEGQSLMTRLGVAFIQNSRKYYPNDAPDNSTMTSTSTEAAAEMVTEYNVAALQKRVDWAAKLTLSLPFSYSGQSIFDDLGATDQQYKDISGYTTGLDADFENTFTTHVTKVISVVFAVRWVYDKYDNSVKPVVDANGTLLNPEAVQRAIRKAGQFKQTMALGMGYSF